MSSGSVGSAGMEVMQCYCGRMAVYVKAADHVDLQV